MKCPKYFLQFGPKLQLINDIGSEITGSISFILLLKLRLGKLFKHQDCCLCLPQPRTEPPSTGAVQQGGVVRPRPHHHQQILQIRQRHQQGGSWQEEGSNIALRTTRVQ